MQVPSILPVFPKDGSYTASAHGNIRVTIDDADSSINRQLLSIQSLYDTLNEDVYTLSTVNIGPFKDTGANPSFTRSVDIVQYADRSLEFTVNAADADFNSALFFPVTNKNTDGIGMSVNMSVYTSSVVGTQYTLREYYPSTLFTGISFGIFDFSTKKSVILYLLDAGKIAICGPSSDGIGSRFEQIVTYDWTQSSIFSIFIGYKDNAVTVLASRSEEAEDTVLLVESLSLFGDCLQSIALANRTLDTSTDVIGFISQDGREVGDSFTVTAFSVYPYSFSLVRNGSFTKYSNNGALYTRAGFILSSSKFATWTAQNASVYSSSTTDTGVQFTSTAGHVQLQYNDLVNNRFYISVTMYASDLSFSGVNSGLGIDIHGANKFEIRYLDGYIGLRTSEDTFLRRTLGGYATYALDPFAAHTFVFYSDGTTFYMFVEVEGTLQLALSYQVSLLPSSTATAISITSEQGLPGVLILRHMLLSPTLVGAILPNINTFSDVTGSYSYSTEPASSTNGNTTYGTSTYPAISCGYATVSKYLPTQSGLCCVFKAAVSSSTGVIPHTGLGPILILNTSTYTTGVSTHALQLYIVRGNDNKLYICFPGADADIREVVYQTNKGKYISAEVPSLSLHFGIMYDPYNGLHVYDLNVLPNRVLIHIPYTNIDISHMLLPNPLGEGVFLPTDIQTDSHFTAATGICSIDNAEVVVDMLLVGTGRGLDVTTFLEPNTVDIQSLYGAKARILVSAGDND